VAASAVAAVQWAAGWAARPPWRLRRGAGLEEGEEEEAFKTNNRFDLGQTQTHTTKVCGWRALVAFLNNNNNNTNNQTCVQDR
jgi:hypothetical protein